MKEPSASASPRRVDISEPCALVFACMGAMALAAGHLLNRYLSLTYVVWEDESVQPRS